jgi:hypothetical protein
MLRGFACGGKLEPGGRFLEKLALFWTFVKAGAFTY